MKPKASLLLHPLFIISLTTLLLNDFYWKYEYGNWLTGKLSDVAGLIVFAIFLSEVFRKVSKTIIVIFVALFFVWWKSHLSQSVIDFFNNTLATSIHRTKDYTDLFALFVLPVIFIVRPWTYKMHEVMQTSLAFSLSVITIISLCSTSYVRHLPYDRYAPSEVRYSEDFCWPGNTEEVLHDLKAKGLTVSEETERYYPLYPAYQELFYRIQTNDSFFQWKPIAFTPDSIVYVKERLYTPNYVVSEYRSEDELFKNIRFRIYQGDNKGIKICVQMISFQSVNGAYETYPDKKTRKKIKRHFESLFGIQKK